MYIGTMDLDWNASVIAITNVNRMRHSEHSKLIETTESTNSKSTVVEDQK